MQSKKENMKSKEAKVHHMFPQLKFQGTGTIAIKISKTQSQQLLESQETLLH